MENKNQLTRTTRTKLTKLADYLAMRVKSDWFNLAEWATDGFQERECGSTACALGWATQCFSRLTLDTGPDRAWAREPTVGVKFVSEGRNFYNMDAAEKFFNIDEETAELLFMPFRYLKENCTTKGEVIRRLRRLVKTGIIEGHTATCFQN